MDIDETIWDGGEDGSMNDEMECMCLGCGISHFLPSGILRIEQIEEEGRKILTYPNCSECGDVLIIIGKAGDEPNYNAG